MLDSWYGIGKAEKHSLKKDYAFLPQKQNSQVKPNAIAFYNMQCK